MQMRVSTSVVCGLERMQMKGFMWEAEGGAMGHGMRENGRKADRFAIVCAHVAPYGASERFSKIRVFNVLHPEIQSLRNELKTEGEREIVACKQTRVKSEEQKKSFPALQSQCTEIN